MSTAGTKRADDRRRHAVLALLGTLAVAMLVGGGVPADAAAEPAGRIERIDLKDDGSSTKVIIMLSRPLPFEVHVLDGDAARKSARRLVLDFANTTLGPEAVTPITVDNGTLQQIRTAQFKTSTARIVLDLASDAKHSVDAYETPPHVTIALGGGAAAADEPADAPAAAPAAPPALFAPR